MKSKKKILIIVAIVLVIIIALAGTVAGMIITGKVAITTRQKLAKGLSDIGNEMSMSKLEENLKEQEKLQETPFEAETTITANVNKMELNNTAQVEEILKEVENAINNTKITNTVQADLKNNIIKENINANVSDIVKEISADIEYNNDTIALRSKELNDKYITFTKDDVESNNEYEELVQILEAFENMCKKETSSLYLTNEEKEHFAKNYGEIFSEYVTDDMIREEKVDITVDGKTKECDNINFTLNKNQIAELVGRYLKKLEEDEKGRQIIISKIQLVVNTFNEEDLQELIEDLKQELLYLEDTTTIKVSVYCTMFTTYGLNIEIHTDDREYSVINLILGKEEDKLNISTNEGEVLKAVKTENKIEFNIFVADENSIAGTITTNGSQQTIVLAINDNEDNVKLDITITTEQKTKTTNENTSESRIQVALQVEDNIVDITLNIASNLRYVNSIETTTFTDSNSINVVTAEQAEQQQYINEVQNNAMMLVLKATQNSKLIQDIYKSITGVIQTYEGMTHGRMPYGGIEQISNQDVQTFNSMFKDYTGIQQGSAMKTLLQQVSISNSTNESHKISVSITGNENAIFNAEATTDPQKITIITNYINSTNDYEVLCTSVDEAGYITGIEIKKQ